MYQHPVKVRFEHLENYAQQKLQEFKLDTLGWKFEWNRAKKFLGFCIYHTKRITMSGFYAANLENSVESLYDTILHEIAHALTGPYAKSHGETWRNNCLLVGAIPERRCQDTSIKSNAKPRYHATCPSCQKVFTMFRRPKYGLHNSHFCKKCGPELGNLIWRRC